MFHFPHFQYECVCARTFIYIYVCAAARLFAKGFQFPQKLLQVFWPHVSGFTGIASNTLVNRQPRHVYIANQMGQCIAKREL